MTTERAEEQKEAGTPEMGGAETAANQGQPALKPGGIGTGVAFDWALTVQIVTEGVFFLLAVGPGSAMAGQPFPARLTLALVSLPAAALVFAQGEALRRGRRVSRIIQIVANSLLPIVGLVNLPGLLQALQARHLGSLVVEVVLLVVSPLIVWLLTRRRTREWFASATSADARARHSGRWLFWIALYAIIGGLAVTFSNYY
jgi:ACR3 family arsenite efflux pump ArsB